MGIYDKGNPYEVKVQTGDTAYICQCGHTNKPLFCDGSHIDHPPAQPFAYEAEKDESIFVCGCGKTNSKPFCDGSHNN